VPTSFSQGDVKTVCQECNKDTGFAAFFQTGVNRTNSSISLEVPEHLLNLFQLDAAIPEFCRIASCKVAEEQVSTFSKVIF
jgi:hypothetical protein